MSDHCDELQLEEAVEICCSKVIPGRDALTEFQRQLADVWIKAAIEGALKAGRDDLVEKLQKAGASADPAT